MSGAPGAAHARGPQHPYRTGAFFRARPQSSGPDSSHLPSSRTVGARSRQPAFLPLGTRARSLTPAQRNSVLPGRAGKQWAFRSRMTPPPSAVLGEQRGREDAGAQPWGLAGLQLGPLPTPSPELEGSVATLKGEG